MNLLNILLAAQPNGGESDPIGTFLPLVLIIVVFYFFMIRPQMKKQKEAKKFRENIQKGADVVTLGGIYGKITEVADDHVMLDVDKGVKLKVDKNALVQNPEELANQKK